MRLRPRALGAIERGVGGSIERVEIESGLRGSAVPMLTVAATGWPSTCCAASAKASRTRSAISTAMSGGTPGSSADKFVATHAADEIERPQRFRRAMAENGQHAVAGAVAEAVVDALEIVEIEQQQGQRHLLERGASDRHAVHVR